MYQLGSVFWEQKVPLSVLWGSFWKLVSLASDMSGEHLGVQCSLFLEAKREEGCEAFTGTGEKEEEETALFTVDLQGHVSMAASASHFFALSLELVAHSARGINPGKSNPGPQVCMCEVKGQ